MKTALMVAFVLASVACGGKAKPGSDSPASEASQGGKPQEMASGPSEAAHKKMATMPPEVVKFHDTLAPRWHAERGAQRTADTCAAIAQFQTETQAIAAAPAPDGANPGAWADSGKQLVEAVVALDATCKAKDAAAFEPAFERVHTSFHHVMEAASAPPAGHADK